MKALHIMFVVAIGLTLTACGGGGGSSSTSSTTLPSSPAGTTYNTDHLKAINQPAAVAIGAEGSGVTVAVLDSGLRRTNQEFSGANILTGFNVPDNNTDTSDISPNDADGHGTHTASLVVGGNVGGAPQATLVPVRMVEDSGTLTTADIANAMVWAGGHAVMIESISAGVTNDSSIVNALNTNAANGMITIIAAGNESLAVSPATILVDPNDQPPAGSGFPAVSAQAMAQTIVVGAVDDNGVKASFSDGAETSEGGALTNYLDAPGVSVSGAGAASDTDYSAQSGTSFSTPLVAAAAADIWSADPSLTAAQVVHVLVSTATDLGTPGVDTVYGSGEVNIAAALTSLGL